MRWLKKTQDNIFANCPACKLPYSKTCETAQNISLKYDSMIILTIRKTFLRWQIPFKEEDIEDIASETNKSFYENKCNSSLSSPAVYLRMKTVNKIVEVIRKKDLFSIKNQNNMLQIDGIEPILDSFDEDDEIDTKKRKQIVRSAVEKLPVTYNMLVKLYYYDELSTSEVCKCLNISEDTFYTRNHRAIKILKKNILKFLKRKNMNDLLTKYIIFYAF